MRWPRQRGSFGMRLLTSLRRCLASADANPAQSNLIHPCIRLRTRGRGEQAHAVRATACCAAQAPPQPHAHTASPVPEDAKTMLKNLTFEELERWCMDMGERCVFLHSLTTFTQSRRHRVRCTCGRPPCSLYAVDRSNVCFVARLQSLRCATI